MGNPPATAPRWFECYRFLLYALAPVLVLMLALLVFEVSAPADADFTTKFRDAIAGQGAVPLPQALAELRGRYIWFAAAILDLVISAYAIVFCGAMTSRSQHACTPRRWSPSRARLLPAAAPRLTSCSKNTASRPSRCSACRKPR